MSNQSTEIEVTDSGKFPFIVAMGVLIAVPVILNIIFLGLFRMEPIWILFINIPCLLIVGIGIPLLIRRKNSYLNPTKFLITDGTLGFLVPGKTPQHIAWSEFDRFKIRVRGFPTTASRAASAISHFAAAFTSSSRVSSSSMTRDFRLKFYSKDSNDVVGKMHIRLFHDDKVGEILALIAERAEKMGKEIIWDGSTKKYYKL